MTNEEEEEEEEDGGAIQCPSVQLRQVQQPSDKSWNSLPVDVVASQ